MHPFNYMKNAFKKIFGYKVKHRSQGPKRTGNVIDSKGFKIRKNKVIKEDKLIHKTSNKDSIKLGEVLKFNLKRKINNEK